jgi:hypothetical protein
MVLALREKLLVEHLQSEETNVVCIPSSRTESSQH